MPKMPPIEGITVEEKPITRGEFEILTQLRRNWSQLETIKMILFVFLLMALAIFFCGFVFQFRT